MNMYWLMYFITRLNGIREFLSTIWITLLVGVIAVAIVYGASVFFTWIGDEDDITEALLKHKGAIIKTLIILIIPTIIFGFLYILTPTVQDAAVIYIVPKIIQNEQLAELPSKGLEFLNSQLDVWIEENLKKKIENKE